MPTISGAMRRYASNGSLALSEARLDEARLSEARLSEARPKNEF